MSFFRLREYFGSIELKSFRFLVIIVIVATIFLADYFLKEDVSDEVAKAWTEACQARLSNLSCQDRMRVMHKQCFADAYTSMMLTFGQNRWQSFQLTQYEDCMAATTEFETPL